LNYLIYANGGGMNSILAQVLGHLKIAEDNGYTPFVDMELHRNYYSEERAILGTRNMWEYYFLPVSSVTREEAYQEGLSLDSGGVFPHSVMNSLFSNELWLLEIFNRYVQLRQETQSALNKARSTVNVGPSVLGIHFRGTDMRTTPHHPLPPTEGQMFRRIDERLNTSDVDKLFLVSEAESYVNSFARRYGSRLSFLDFSRQGKVDIFVDRPRKNHRYLLGLENLIETKLLSECGGLVSGYSGLSEMAHVLGRENLQTVEKIWNGRVPGRPKLLTKHIWSYRQAAPKFLGGFAP
jgi:hypothetical protein